MAEDTLRPRLYQEQLGERSFSKNTIIHLPTGSGKTYIAIMLIKRMKEKLRLPLEEGGKKAVFLVNNVPLVEQQKEVINYLAPVRVGGFSSENKVDLWKKDKWDLELSKYNVLVMTSQILLNILTHSYISLKDINLIIFDECHHAVENHPMREIMKLFQLCPPSEQPRVLGLTATLLNANVKTSSIVKTIEDLETTFHATIATVNDMGEVLSYSTNPREAIFTYEPPNPCTAGTRAISELKNLIDTVMGVKFECAEYNLRPDLGPNQQDITVDAKETNKKVKNKIQDAVLHIEELGLFGGSMSILAQIITFERLLRRCETVEYSIFFKMVSTNMQMVRAMLLKAMSDENGYAQIVKYSTKKVLQLLTVLKEFDVDNFTPNQPRNLRVNLNQKPLSAIIFAKRRFTCKVLHNILKAVKETNPKEFSFLNNDFIVGFNVNPYNNTREELFEKKYSMCALLKFSNKDINCLISTSVIEEGVDIPQCSLVMRFDPPEEYRSYIQSKGRARCETSNYVILVNKQNERKFREKYGIFQECERHIQDLLVGQVREAPTLMQIERDLYNDAEIPPFILPYGDNASISEVGATSLLNQYCSMLPRDQYTEITPSWVLERTHGKKMIIIHMPINCPIKNPIKGMPMESLKSAKRSAALEACKALYFAGELNPKTGVPKKYAAVDFEAPDVKKIFLNWEEELIKKGDSYPGTKKRIRKHVKVYPKCFEGVSGWKFGARTFNMHLITMMPAFDEPEDSRDLALYRLLRMDHGYAVLTAHPMPKLCDFPMFLSVGEVRTTIEVNYGAVTLNRDQFDQVKEFHHFVFDKLLNVAKKFVAFDGSVNAAYVVPVMKEATGFFDINWDVIHTYKDIPTVACPTDEERKKIEVKEDYKYAVVTPWYRGSLLPDRYIVAEVMTQTTLNSSFEKEECGTYADYYSSKYNLNVLGRQDQPLLEVKQINSRGNCLLPRAATLNTLSGKQLRLASAAQGDDKASTFRESLVPEFCIKYDFPGVLWYKATVLPSILHRMSMLLVANDLRIEICQATKLGTATLAQSQRWNPLTVDVHVTTSSLLAYCDGVGSVDNHSSIDRINCPPGADGDDARPVRVTTIQDRLFKIQLKQLNQEFPWDESKEPMDIERNLTLVTPLDIECYDDFVTARVAMNQTPVSSPARSHAAAICPPPLKYLDKIKLLSKNQNIYGLQLCDLLSSLTTINSNDTFNLERSETLGDSFLKFAATLYLFHKFPKLNEGQLTNIKSRLIGNRNLFYAGRRVNLGGRIKAEKFMPRDDFVVPGFSVPRPIVDFITENKIRPTFLIGVELDRSEQLSGEVREQTLAMTQARCDESGLVEKEPDNNIQMSMQCYLHKQCVSDKVVADCVESLVGVHLVSCGIIGGVRILEWLRVLPAVDNFESYLTRRIATSLTEGRTDLSNINRLLNHNLDEIQQIIKYTFKDPALLLEALSHPSFNMNRVTRSYERLEFLGDAVLDFLITAHIFESYGTLTPGQLTDLRSSLVNNVTFAGYVVKLGLHKYMLSQINPALERAIMGFVQHQENRNHNITEDVLYLIDEEDCRMAQYVEVPKSLSDLYESLAGAIFLDSGGDLQRVWDVYYAIMCREIDNFSKNIPIQPVRLLRERIHACPHFGEVKQVSPDVLTLMAPVSLTVNGRILKVYGFGANKRQAQRAAAKLALKSLDYAS